jgi:DNA mismatch repair protein MutH
MKAGLMLRIARLEGTDDAGRQIAQVIWLGLDGEPEIPLADRDPDRPVIFLPRKAASAEEWAKVVRQRWPQYGGGDDDAS